MGVCRINPNMRFILFLSLPLYALDQLTKHWVLRSISPYDARIVVPDFFNLVNVTNTGAAFGSFKGNNTFFVVISIIALVVVTVLLVRHRRSPAAGTALRVYRRQWQPRGAPDCRGKRRPRVDAAARAISHF